MRTLKKTLCLVLALALSFSLLGIGASAMTYSDVTDKASITYTEAVDVMVNLGIIDGVGNNQIDPSGYFTREAAAKIVAYMKLGTVASALKASSAPFTDVAADRWSAGYIAYCVSEGIINGNGDGTFGPEAKLTGYAWAKMLLAAVGYGQNDEFVGASWAINVAKVALDKGVFESNLGDDYSATATREEAILYAFNTLTAIPAVNYSEVFGSYYVGDSVLETLTAAQKQAYTLGATVFKLDTDDQVSFGDNGYYWVKGTAKTKVSSFYTTDKVLGTNYGTTAIANLMSTTSTKYVASAETDGAVAYVNGIPVIYGSNADAVDEDAAFFTYNDVIYYADDTINAVTEAGYVTAGTMATHFTSVVARGVVVELVDEQAADGTYNGKVDRVDITVKAVYKVTAAPTTTTTGTITKVTVAGTPVTDINVKYVQGYTGLAKNDIVLFHTMYNFETKQTYYIFEKPTSVTGTQTAYASETIKVGGTNYYASGLAGAPVMDTDDSTVVATALNGSNYIGVADVVYYLDNGGNVVYAVAPTSTVVLTNYVYISNAIKVEGLTTSYKATAVFMDGTTQEITVAKTAKADGSLAVVTGNVTTGDASAVTASGMLVRGAIYTFTVNDSGTYNLKAVATSATYGHVDVGADGLDNDDTNYNIYGKNANFLNKVTYDGAAWPTTAGTAQNIYATSATVFLYWNNTNKAYTVYTGINNAPTYKCDADSEIRVLKNSSGYALAVIATDGASDNTISGADIVYVLSEASVNYVVSNSTTYNTYDAIVNGTVTTIDSTSDSPLTQFDLYSVTAYTSGRVSTAADTSSLFKEGGDVANTSIKYSNGTMLVGTNGYVLSDTCKIFLINETTEAVTELAAADLGTLAAGTYTVHVKLTSSTNSAVQYVFLSK